MPEQFLILGATGTVGRRVLESMIAGGYDVKGASRRKMAPGWVILDLLDPATHAQALAEVSTVMLTSRPADEDAHIYARPLIDAMVKQGIRRVVALSALGAEVRPEFSLRKVEILVEQSGMEWTFVRPNFFMQMLAAPPLSTEMAMHNTLSLPLAQSRIAYVDADDVAAVLVRALVDPALSGQSIEVSGPQALTHDEIVGRISHSTGRHIRYIDLGEEAARQLLLQHGFAPPKVDRLMRFYALVRQGHCATPDSKVAALLGRPLGSFDHFVETNTAAWQPGQSAA